MNKQLSPVGKRRERSMRTALTIPIELDGGWLAQVVIPRDMTRGEMLKMRRVLWTLAVPWK